MRPDHADPPGSVWNHAELAWPTPAPSPRTPSSLPSLVPVSGTTTGSSIWRFDPFGSDRFCQDVDDALDGVEEEVEGRLAGFAELVIDDGVREELGVNEGFDIRTQVAYRSAGPPWLSSGESSEGSSDSPIYVE